MEAPLSWSYKLKESINERQESPTYCVSFNNVDPQHAKLLATCTGPRVTVYDCVPDGRMEPVQGYVDEDLSEEYYVVRWGKQEGTGSPLLFAAGLHGYARVFNCNTQSLIWTAHGHGSSINDIAVHPTCHDLFVTASRDYSLRMWNHATKVCVIIISGEEAHTNEVLSVDFNLFDADCLLSGGMDDTVKVWSLKGCAETIERSKSHNEEEGLSFKTAILSYTAFTSRKVHWNYVDCVKWMGHLIVSKSVDNRILMWQVSDDPDTKSRHRAAKSGVHLLQEFYLEDADIWFIRFSMDLCGKILTCGSRFGRLFVWDLTAKSEKASRPKQILRVPVKDKATIRQTAVSADGSIIVGCCDDASIHRFDRVYKTAPSSRGTSVSTDPAELKRESSQDLRGL